MTFIVKYEDPKKIRGLICKEKKRMFRVQINILRNYRDQNMYH